MRLKPSFQGPCIPVHCSERLYNPNSGPKKQVVAHIIGAPTVRTSDEELSEASFPRISKPLYKDSSLAEKAISNCSSFSIGKVQGMRAFGRAGAGFCFQLTVWQECLLHCYYDYYTHDRTIAIAVASILASLKAQERGDTTLRWPTPRPVLRNQHLPRSPAQRRTQCCPAFPWPL